MMSININITASSPAELEDWLRGLGFVREASVAAKHRPAPTTGDKPTVWPYGVSAGGFPNGGPNAISKEQAERLGLTGVEDQPTEIVTDRGEDPNVVEPCLDANAPPGHITSEFGGYRKHGEPSPGRQRRTKREMEEDKDYEARKRLVETAEAAKAQREAGLVDEDDRRFGPPHYGHNEASQLSTGEDRIDPEQAAEQARLDAEDEAAEGGVGEADQLTHDDLRHVIGEFTKLVGMVRAAREVKEIIGCGVENIPNTQEALKEAIDKMADAYHAEKAFQPPSGAEPVIEEREAFTRDDVRAVIKEYAIKYDGTGNFEDSSKIPNMLADIGVVVKEVSGVPALRMAADTPEMNEKLYSAIYKALHENRFGRKALA